MSIKKDCVLLYICLDYACQQPSPLIFPTLKTVYNYHQHCTWADHGSPRRMPPQGAQHLVLHCPNSLPASSSCQPNKKCITYLIQKNLLVSSWRIMSHVTNSICLLCIKEIHKQLQSSRIPACFPYRHPHLSFTRLLVWSWLYKLSPRQYIYSLSQ